MRARSFDAVQTQVAFRGCVVIDDTILLDESTRRKFDQLMLVASKVRVGAIKGERRSNKRGTSIEFADYRNYAPGDDLRRLDWNLYARLERPYVKLFEDEEDLAVHLILDASASMAFPLEGDPAHNKFCMHGACSRRWRILRWSTTTLDAHGAAWRRTGALWPVAWTFADGRYAQVRAQPQGAWCN